MKSKFSISCQQSICAAVILAPLWQTFISSLEIYKLSLIEGSEDQHAEMYNSDGGEKSLESFIIQVHDSFMNSFVMHSFTIFIYAKNYMFSNEKSIQIFTRLICKV